MNTEIYLNGKLILKKADSLEIHDETNYYHDNKGYRFYDKGGEYFTVTVNMKDSTVKEFRVRQCVIFDPEFLAWHLNTMQYYEPMKIFLID